MNASANPIDSVAAHRFFSTSCFNAVWGLLDQPNRSAEDEEQMISLAHASLWHWTRRDDCSSLNRSVGYWQLSRVYATIGHGERARHYGALCLAASKDSEPFYRGYAHEALARAAGLLGEADVMHEQLQCGRHMAAGVSASEEQGLLLGDLETVKLVDK